MTSGSSDLFNGHQLLSNIKDLWVCNFRVIAYDDEVFVFYQANEEEESEEEK